MSLDSELTVTRLDGEEVSLHSLVEGQKTVLVFLRHFGWLFCREQVARIVEHQDEIEALGGKVIAIGNGSVEHAIDFRNTEGVDIDLYVDPSRKTYKSWDMKRGPATVTGPKTVVHAARAVAAGFRQTETRGSISQVGGVIVLDADGTTLYEHIESEAGDVADYDEVVDALR